MNAPAFTPGLWVVDQYGDVQARAAGAGMSAQTTGVLTVMDRMTRSVGARNDHTRDADLAAAHEACATVEGLINALSVLADAAEARGIPVDAARAALAKARGDA